MSIQRIQGNVSFGAMHADRAQRMIIKARHALQQRLEDPSNIYAATQQGSASLPMVVAVKDGKIFTGKFKIDNFIYRYKNGLFASLSTINPKTHEITTCQRVMKNGLLHDKTFNNGQSISMYRCR